MTCYLQVEVTLQARYCTKNGFKKYPDLPIALYMRYTLLIRSFPYALQAFAAILENYYHSQLRSIIGVVLRVHILYCVCT